MSISVSKDNESKKETTQKVEADPIKELIILAKEQAKTSKEQADSITNLVEDVRMLQGKNKSKPSGFAEKIEGDEGVPEAVSKAVRGILGNSISLRGYGSDDLPGFKLEVIIPHSLHTKNQIEGFINEREDIKMKDGRIVGRGMVKYETIDKRTRFIPNHGSVAEAAKWAQRVADNIRAEYSKNKLPEPDFFKEDKLNK